MSRVKLIAYLFKVTGANWLKHDAARIGAALSYYTLLSLAPLVILAIAVGGMFFGGTITEQHLIQQVQQLAGAEAARVVRTLAQQAANTSSSGIASIVGVITILLGASGVFGELRSALNIMWEVDPQGSSGVGGMIKARLLSIGMVLGIGFVLVVSLVASTALAAFTKYFEGLLPVPASLLQAVNFLVSFFGIAIMFALVLRYVPDATLAWCYLWVGAIINALLFTIGKSLIGLYLGRAAVGSLYGTGGSIVVITVWTYYSAQLFLFGAEFTWVYAQHRTFQNNPPNHRADIVPPPGPNTGPHHV